MKIQDTQGAINFSADRPIETAKEDLLNRAGFAGRLAKAIKSWSGKESLVIGICGRWGVGKSSVKNLIRESLALSKDSTSPEVIEFIPWQISGDEKLTTVFFDELGKAIGRADDSESAKKTIRLLKQYQAKFRVGTYILNSFPAETARRAISFIVGIAGLSLWQGALINLTAFLILCLFAGVLWLATWLDGLFTALIDFFETKLLDDNNSLQEIKSELSDILSKLKRPVVMMIDDIDRLTDHEISLLFRLIKSNADFPNVIYLLLFDRVYVEDALNCLLPSKNGERGEHGRGGEYLKKIVQVVFDLPESDRGQVRKILFSNLDRLLEENDASQLWEKERWGLLYQDGIDPFFKTVRDVNRYLSSLSFTMGAFKGERKFEANPIDIIGLEVIRIFEPEVYERLKLLKSSILKTTKRLFQDREKDEAKEELLKLFVLASPAHRNAVEIIIKILFPYTGSILGEYSYGGGTVEDWYKQLRVCNEEIFDRYFEFEVPSNDISLSEIVVTIELTNDTDKFLSKLVSYWDGKKLDPILYALDVHKDEIPIGNFPHLAEAFFALIDKLPRFRGDILDRDPSMSCARILLYMLKKIGTEDERVEILGLAIQNATAAYLPWYLVYLISKLRKEGWGDIGPIFEKESSMETLNRKVGSLLDALGAQDKIPWLKSGGLLNHWKEWGTQSVIDDWVKRSVSKDNFLIEFLKGFLHGLQSSGTTKMGWALNVEELGKLTDLQEMDSRVENVPKDDLNDMGQLTIQAYRLSRDRQKKGLKTDMFISESYIWSEIREIA